MADIWKEPIQSSSDDGDARREDESPFRIMATPRPTRGLPARSKRSYGGPSVYSSHVCGAQFALIFENRYSNLPDEQGGKEA